MIGRSEKSGEARESVVYPLMVSQTAGYYPQEKESDCMSFCCCIINGNGFVMAADSRSSIPTSDGKALLSWEDNFTKIVYLPKSEIAVIAAGVNRIEDNDITTFLLNNDSSQLQFSHDVKRGLEHFGKLIREKTGQPCSLCAATLNQSLMLESCFININRDNKIQKNQGLWHIGAENCDTVSILYLKTNNELLVHVRNMTLATMVGFARHLVQTSCALAQYRSDILPVVGGPVQILAVNGQGRIVVQENC